MGARVRNALITCLVCNIDILLALIWTVNVVVAWDFLSLVVAGRRPWKINDARTK
jgi:hypothetical protein